MAQDSSLSPYTPILTMLLMKLVRPSHPLPPSFLPSSSQDGLHSAFVEAEKHFNTSAGIIMGDFNADCSYVTSSDWASCVFSFIPPLLSLLSSLTPPSLLPSFFPLPNSSEFPFERTPISIGQLKIQSTLRRYFSSSSSSPYSHIFTSSSPSFLTCARQILFLHYFLPPALILTPSECDRLRL